MKSHRFDPRKFLVKEGELPRLAKMATSAGDELPRKADGVSALDEDIKALQEAQERLHAASRRSLLVILQGMDTAGKDGIIRHVLRGVSPLGCRVHGFRAPNTEELEHHFLWRPMRFLPPQGVISLFNRSYYEEVLVVRVHPKFLDVQHLMPYESLSDLWKRRFHEIRGFEETLVESGMSVLKFFLHISKDEQRRRLLERLEDPQKHWKFNAGDLEERKLWPRYTEAFEEAMANTSTQHAPWYIIPADDKWYARAAVADIITSHLESLDLQFPSISRDDLARFDDFATSLRNERS